MPQHEIQHLNAAALQQLLDAALRHDDLHHDSILAPFLVWAILSGARRGELLALGWGDVDHRALDDSGKRVGEITLRCSLAQRKNPATKRSEWFETQIKTGRVRRLDLAVSPMLRELLAIRRLQASDRDRFVWGDQTWPLPSRLQADLARCIRTFGAPTGVGWNLLRHTTATYLRSALGEPGAERRFGISLLLLRGRR